MKADYVRALKLPIVSFLLTYLIMAVTIKLFPILEVSEGVVGGFAFFAIFGWGFGVWVGYKIVEFKGNFLDVIIVGVIISVIGAALQITVVGMITAFPSSVNLSGELTAAAYNAPTIFQGALAAGGFALTK